MKELAVCRLCPTELRRHSRTGGASGKHASRYAHVAAGSSFLPETAQERGCENVCKASNSADVCRSQHSAIELPPSDVSHSVPSGETIGV